MEARIAGRGNIHFCSSPNPQGWDYKIALQYPLPENFHFILKAFKNN
tara:strand:- start:992 stop:1132 length:141 start_codon:yes stop_codon:yes gene_type:complete